MNWREFFRQSAVGAALAVSAGVAHTALSTIIGPEPALRAVIVGVAGGYICYLLLRSEQSAGWITMLLAWAAVSAGMWVAAPELGAVLITQVIAISLVRSIFHHASGIAFLLDLGLSAAALAFAVWASVETGSLMLTAWSFFLVQALFVGIPPRLPVRGGEQPDACEPDTFSRALRTANMAIRQIVGQR